MSTNNEPLKILAVDDEAPIRKLLTTILETEGYAVQQAENGGEAIARITKWRPDIVLLDLGLPDLDGCEIIRRVREWSSVPIIVLSVRSQEADKVAALNAGADDYLTKPFGASELIARIRAALRRVVPLETEPVLSFDDLIVDLACRRVTAAGQAVQLTPTEYDLLRLLALNAGKVLTHTQIMKQVWGATCLDQPHLLRVNISNLRHKIEQEPSRPRHILTEAGVGYRFRDSAPPCTDNEPSPAGPANVLDRCSGMLSNGISSGHNRQALLHASSVSTADKPVIHR